MATSIPCIKGRMGSIDYYLTTMKAGEAVAKVRIAKELPNWDDMTIEEKVQREINWERVEKEIARYLAEDKDRFFNSLVVGIYNDAGIEFEALTDIERLPKLYQNAAKSFGLLHLQGGELFFALDGQHRLMGLQVAMSGKTHDDKELSEFEVNRELANEDIAAVLIPFEPAKRSRKIFNKINKYAKQTSKGDNIITSEDDTFAIVSRWLMGSDGHPAVLNEGLVNWKSNTLSQTATKFTTVSVLYEAARVLLSKHKIDPQFRDEAKLEAAYQEVKEVWEALFKDFKPFANAIKVPKQQLPKLREHSLALKPVGQIAIIEAVQLSREHGMSLTEIASKLNKIQWELDEEVWQNVLVLPGGRVQTGKTPVRLASRLIAYLIHAKLPKEKVDELLMDYQKATEKASLPAKAA